MHSRDFCIKFEFCVYRFILTAMDEVKKHIKSSEEEAEQKIKLLQVQLNLF